MSIDAAFQQPDPLFTVLINTYISYVERALYARREPSEEDAEAVEQLVEVLRKTAEIKRRKIADRDAELAAERDRVRRERDRENEHMSDMRRRRNTVSATSTRRKGSLFDIEPRRDGQSSPSSMGAVSVNRHASLPLNQLEGRPRSRRISHASTSARSGLPPSILASTVNSEMASKGSGRSRADGTVTGGKRIQDIRVDAARDEFARGAGPRPRTMSNASALRRA